MDRLRQLISRDSMDNDSSSDASDGFFTSSMLNLIIGLLALVCIGLALAGLLYLIRRRRQALQRQAILPTHHNRNSNHRRLTITASPYPGGRTQSVYVYNEKRDLEENSYSPPPSPVPEIRITFPDEEDVQGKRKSGKVVVVRIGDSGSIGMEPVGEDALPPYQSSDAERFQSLDLERMGGLKEKDMKQWA